MDFIILGVALFLLLIFVLRLIGAWMLRINDVIEELYQIRKLLDDRLKKDG